MSNNDLPSISSAKSSVEEISRRMLAFREPIFGEDLQEKNAYIRRNYPNMPPFQAKLDIGLTNYMLKNTICENTWNALVRYSMKLPTFYNRIIQPRVRKCYHDRKRFYIINRYVAHSSMYGYYYFDPMYFYARQNIYIVDNDILAADRRKRYVMSQTKHCLNSIQGKSLLMLDRLYGSMPAYNLDFLNYSRKYKLGYLCNRNDYEDENTISDDEDMDDTDLY